MTTPTPYYSDEWTTIYHTDTLDVLPHLSGLGAVVTDPPYSSGGAFRGDRTRNVVDKYTNTGTMAYQPEFAGDTEPTVVPRVVHVVDERGTAGVRRGHANLSFIDWRQLPTLTDAVQAAGWTWRGVAVWSKGFGRPTPGRFSNACEYVVWGSNGPMTIKDEEGAEGEDRLQYPPGVFECSSPHDRVHVAQKPVDVMRWILRIVRPGSTVLDPFMGSGSTLRAARDMGIRAIGIDSDERYCQHAAEQLAQGSLFSFLDDDEAAAWWRYAPKIIGGDCRDILPTIGTDTVNLVVTSPPYLAQRRYGSDEHEIGREQTLAGFVDTLADVFDEVRRVLKPTGWAIVNIGDKANGSGGAGGDWGSSSGGPRTIPATRRSRTGSFLDVPGAFSGEMIRRGWRLRMPIVWDKGREAPEALAHVRRPRWSHEMIYMFQPAPARATFVPAALAETGSVWHFPPGGNGNPHLAPFPDELARRCILPTTLPGDVVLDPFSGSGTVPRVASELGRKGLGIELYHDRPDMLTRKGER